MVASGVIYRTLQVLTRSAGAILNPFYHKDAFIRKQESIDGFLRQLRGLWNVDIIVDTMTVLSHPPLYLYEMEDKRKMNEAVTAGFHPATTALATKSASPSGRDGKGINVGVIIRGRLQSKLMTKMQEQRKNGLGAMGGSIQTNFENNRKRLIRLVPRRPGGSPTSKAEKSPFKKELSPSKGSFLISLAHHNTPVYLEFHRN